MRPAILLSLVVWGAMCCGVRADESFHRVEIDANVGYVVPESYADAHKAEIKAAMPGRVKLDGFWTPVDMLVVVADHNLRTLIRAAAKDPAQLFPDLPKTATGSGDDAGDSLDNEAKELGLIADNFDAYTRQYVGIIVDGEKFILCQYSTGTPADPAHEFIVAEKYFVSGKTHFLQCRVQRDDRTVSHLSHIGPWASEKGN